MLQDRDASGIHLPRCRREIERKLDDGIDIITRDTDRVEIDQKQQRRPRDCRRMECAWSVFSNRPRTPDWLYVTNITHARSWETRRGMYALCASRTDEVMIQETVILDSRLSKRHMGRDLEMLLTL